MKIHDEIMNESPTLIIALSVAIIILCCLIIASAIFFMYVRNKIKNRNRQRLNDNQELTFQGPILSIVSIATVYISPTNLVSIFFIFHRKTIRSLWMMKCLSLIITKT